jgi:S-formylglutathione hydrolase FrmB
MDMNKTILVLLAAVMVMMISCSGRENPMEAGDIPHGEVITNYERTFNRDELVEDGSTNWANYRSRNMVIYTPPGYVFDPPGNGPKFPTLYLLHDFMSYVDTAASYIYNRIGLTADRLIATGEIEPMVIVMADLSTPLGGGFYTDGWTHWSELNPVKIDPGNFEQAVVRDLLFFMEEDGMPDRPFNIIPVRESRAIAGVGMGGYGAVKLALKHPDIFSSASSIDGFLSFEDGIDSLIDQVFIENGITKGNRDEYLNDIDTSFSKPVTNLFYSMAGAFSPHDPEGDFDETYQSEYGVDLPFDENGDIVVEIWDKWMDNDMSTIVTDFSGSLSQVALRADYSTEDEYHADLQTKAFIEMVDGQSGSVESESYSGYEGYPARHGYFNYERLAEILKFHSEHLSSAVPAE